MSWSELPPDKMIKTLTAVIRAYCPEAAIETGNNLFTAKYGTMMFTLHGKSMTGEITATTHQEEGPNFKGFVLMVSMEKGPYTGQAVIPHVLHGPYYPTFIDGPPTKDGTNHYRIVFSYGSRLDPKLKQAIFDALPKSRTRRIDK